MDRGIQRALEYFPIKNQFRADTMTELHDAMCSTMLYAHRDSYDWITGTDVIKEHVVAQADSMDWHCDIARFWLPHSRWTMMINQYLDPEGHPINQLRIHQETLSPLSWP